MISVIVYGRNDSHGYNLHKRAAISLNTMAEVLTHESDEIIFTDYNTPNEFPTFPEAIADTLTDKCKRLLKIYRVRPNHHLRVGGFDTHLPVIEPVARNVALRRSNPQNRWVLSTNTDMIFLPKNTGSLSENVRELASGYYVAPRFELPETIWESFSRDEPRQIIEELANLGKAIHIEEKVYTQNLFDAPGDFQLIERDVLTSVNGFDEDMIYGWHVDSNIGRRMELYHNRICDGSILLDGYHCDHTRQITAAHKSGAVQNDILHFVNQIETDKIVLSNLNWGLPDETLEEIFIEQNNAKRFSKIIYKSVGAPQQAYYTADITPDARANPNRMDQVCSEHVLPYLFDLLFTAPPAGLVLWVGKKDRLFTLLEKCVNEAGLNIQLCGLDEVTKATYNKTEVLNQKLQNVIFNCGTDEKIDTQARQELFMSAGAVARLLDEFDLKKLVRLVAVNPYAPLIEEFFGQLIASATLPFSTRLKHGLLSDKFGEPFIQRIYLLDEKNSDLRKMYGFFARDFDLKKLLVGQFLTQEPISQETIRSGKLIQIPWLFLKSGQYSINLKLSTKSKKPLGSGQLLCLGYLQDNLLVKDTIDFGLSDQIQCELEFTLVDSYMTLHFLFLNSSGVELVIEDASLQKIGFA